MIIAFLDMLGFSNLLYSSTETAYDNFFDFNNMIKTRFIDYADCKEKNEQKDKNNKNYFSFTDKHRVNSFENMISFSDCLVLGSTNIDLFIAQLSNFVASLYIESSEAFTKEFNNIHEVKNNKWFGIKDNELYHHNAFPILFRGGLSNGNNAYFFSENNIENGRFEIGGYNVFGETYLNAVSLEKIGKGPRLFCDDSVVEKISKEENKRSIRKILSNEKNYYEIVWTIEACEAMERCSNTMLNVDKAIREKLLPAAINFAKYYKNDEKLFPHYEELLTCVCRGIARYADINKLNVTEVIERINIILEKNNLNQYSRDTLFDGFIF